MNLRYLLVNVLVAEDGVQPHPMDNVIVRVDLDENSEPLAESMRLLDASVRRRIVDRVRRRRTEPADPWSGA